MQTPPAAMPPGRVKEATAAQIPSTPSPQPAPAPRKRSLLIPTLAIGAALCSGTVLLVANAWKNNLALTQTVTLNPTPEEEESLATPTSTLVANGKTRRWTAGAVQFDAPKDWIEAPGKNVPGGVFLSPPSKPNVWLAVWFEPGRNDLDEILTDGFFEDDDDGLDADGEPSTLAVPAGNARRIDVTGGDEVELGGGAVAVQNPAGGAAVFVGVGPEGMSAEMRAAADRIARTARFPKVSQAGH